MQQNTPISKRHLPLAADMLPPIDMSSPKLNLSLPKPFAQLRHFKVTAELHIVDQHNATRHEHLTCGLCGIVDTILIEGLPVAHTKTSAVSTCHCY